MKMQDHFKPFIGKWWMWFLLIFFGFLTACQNQSKGFVLPEGNAEVGKQTFVDLNCNRCHTIDDIQWSGSKEAEDPKVPLGGDVSSIKTYGELVTSVFNPSHKISQQSLPGQKLVSVSGASKMELYHYNDIMTVQELIDVVTYLQSQYNVVTPENPYPEHGF